MFLSQPGMRDVGVVPLGAHHGLDRVGDQVARLQRVAHALGAHRDAVADADGVEPHADQAGGLRRPSLTFAARSLRCMLQVLPSYHTLAMPTCGFVHVGFASCRCRRAWPARRLGDLGCVMRELNLLSIDCQESGVRNQESNEKQPAANLRRGNHHRRKSHDKLRLQQQTSIVKHPRFAVKQR